MTWHSWPDDLPGEQDASRNLPMRSSAAATRNTADLLDELVEPGQSTFPPTRNARDLIAVRNFLTRSRSDRHPEFPRPARESRRADPKQVFADAKHPIPIRSQEKPARGQVSGIALMLF
ncbi:hypothetical protein FHW12_000105 [Dokdonella fugitiva]|uniref:Uncharacterized protein n=1 Tax=Dokdonella fugitiva TaxID=328517 RepID=A0A839F0R8_9GAMM|nr:hypothetical protein [Dokdonella fugitiva]MBA8885914.1 hypothetical protein [Dokdonella fugitiva]